MRYALKLVVLLLLVSVFSGCGGGGGGGGTQNVIRDMRAGDEWLYDVVLTHGANTYYGAGATIVTALTYPDFYGNTYRCVSEAVVVEDTGVSKLLYISQDANGTLRYHGEFQSPSTIQLVTNPSTGYCIYFRSPMIVGDRYGAQSITYNTGQTGTWIAEVVGKEQITVPAGTFDCYKISANYSPPGGHLITITIWVSCDAGWVVKQVNTDGLTVLTRLLSTKNRSAAKIPDGVPDPKIEKLLRSLM